MTIDNSLLYSVPITWLNKRVQHVQNSLARVVTQSPKFTSSKPLLEKLHWLPIISRINFKIATLTYKAVHLDQPPSLRKYLKIKRAEANSVKTRYNDGYILEQPSGGKNKFGCRAFSYTAPAVWNKLPSCIRKAPSVMSFRKQLKTHYFKNPPKPPDGSC